MIRGGIVDPQPKEIAERALFHRHHSHQNSHLENKNQALASVQEVRDDFGLRGRSELYRVRLKNMASAHQLHYLENAMALLNMTLLFQVEISISKNSTWDMMHLTYFFELTQIRPRNYPRILQKESNPTSPFTSCKQMRLISTRETDFRTFYGNKIIGFPAKYMVAFDFENIREDGRAKWNLFTAKGKSGDQEQWVYLEVHH